MRRAKKTNETHSKKAFRWRTSRGKWTDTLFDKKLLSNPSLMTSIELAKALEEYQEWRKGAGKYSWISDPIKEKAETEPPFSPKVWSNLIMETIARLSIGGGLALGRFKNHV